MTAKNLFDQVAFVAKATGKRLPINETVLISGGGVGCYDLNISASAKVQGLDESLLACVDAKELLNALKPLKDATIVLGVNHDYSLKIVAQDRTCLTLSGVDPADFPATGWLFKKIGYLTAADIANVARLRPFLNTDGLRPAMECISLNGKVVATDGHRLVWEPTEGQIFDIDRGNEMLLPRQAAPLLAGATYCEVYRTEDRYMLEWANRSISFKMVDERYPAWESVVATDFANVYTFDREALISKVTAARMAANKTTRQVVFHFDHGAGMAQIEAKNIDFGTGYTTDIAINIERSQSAPFSIGFNASFLLELLKLCTGPHVHLKLNASNKAAVINSNKLLMPVMIENYV